MPIKVNLRHLEEDNVQLNGELSVEELDIDSADEVIRVSGPMAYDLEAQLTEEGLLISGIVDLAIDCQCVRCLKKFKRKVSLEPHWSRLLPFTGEEPTPVHNDCVDLTPYVREDILLEFPQHPLCDPECGGLPETKGKPGKISSSTQKERDSSAWAALDKLRF